MKWNFFVLFILLLLLVAIFQTFQSFALSLLLSFLFATTIDHFRLRFLPHFNRTWASIILVLLFATTIIFPISFLLVRGVHIAIESGQQYLSADFFNSTLESLKKYPLFNDFFGDLLESGKLREPMMHAGAYVLNLVKGLLENLPFLGLQLIIFIVGVLFCLLNMDKLKGFLKKLSGMSDQNFTNFYNTFQDGGRLVVLSNVLTALFQSWMACFAVLITQTSDVFLIGFLTLFLSFVPIIGAAPVIYFLCVRAFLEGQTSIAIVLLCFAMIMTFSDNLLRTYLSSRHKKDVHPFLNFVSIIGGVMAFGISGLFLGPFIVTMTIRLTPLLMNELRSSHQS